MTLLSVVVRGNASHFLDVGKTEKAPLLTHCDKSDLEGSITIHES